MAEGLTSETVTVRSLQAKDVEAVVEIDARITGRKREEFFRVKVAQALEDTGIAISLAAERNGRLVGFLLARVYYGEFGIMEPVAVLDAIGVDPRFAGRGAGHEMMEQLATNLAGLGITRLQTEVGWDKLELLSFFHREGFHPAPRLCLDLDLRSRVGVA